MAVHIGWLLLVMIWTLGCSSPDRRQPDGRPPSPTLSGNAAVKVVSIHVLGGDKLAAVTSDGRAALSHDAGDSWSPIGPPGERTASTKEVRGLAWLDARLYAVTPEGLYQSQDMSTWVVASEGNHEGRTLYGTPHSAWLADHRGRLDAVVGTGALDDGPLITAVAETPSKVLLAASFGRGVLVSDDQGASWKASNQGLDNVDATAVVALADGKVLVGTFGGGIYRSSDGGHSFESASKGLEDAEIQALATDGKGLVVAGAQRGAFRSVDGGSSWERLPDPVGRQNVQSLAFDSQRRAFAGTWGNGLFRSTDEGASWTRLWLRDERGDLLAVARAKNGSLRISARSGHVYGVQGDGEDWHDVGEGSVSSSPIHALQTTPEGGLIAASAIRLYQLSGSPGSWSHLEKYPASRIGGFVISSEGEMLVRTGAPNESGRVLYASGDAGATWTTRKDECLKGSDGARLRADPTGRIIVNGCSCVSVDSGRTWKAIEVPHGHLCRSYLGVSHGVAVGSNNFSDFGIYVAAHDGPFESRADLKGAPSCVAVTSTGEVIIVAESKVVALPANKRAVEERATGNFACADMAVTAEDALVMVGALGAFRSADGGKSWQRIGPPKAGNKAAKRSKP